jgi:outer membrane receptor protein involved in Fe transport
MGLLESIFSSEPGPPNCLYVQFRLNPTIRDQLAAVDNAVVLPGYIRADAAIFFNVTERWRLQVNAENLFDRRYYLNADGNNNISPGSSRAVRVGLTARF